MNTAELETLIRTILSEKLAPTPPAPQQEQGIFCDVGSAIDAAHQAFLRYQQCPLKTRSAIISALRETLAPRAGDAGGRERHGNRHGQQRR
ncbi:coA-acylating propionaldehyde dehydrogenase [Klebsiella pneumoniae]|uniref:CoA-acylating propionaldehyde dehydrogenase n=1 Tax=Klebsiella pneumoniae TaxID=573 RepID=A0A377U1C2_KLEPN|nr:coA-acylating propionaldehyde dehydrogenase [Klebsiella pneumoniae]